MTPPQEDIARTQRDVQHRHQSNTIAWNEAAAQYTREIDDSIRDLRAGRSNLHPVERRMLAPFGPLSDWCQRAIHLQCASGYDTMSLILEGVHEAVGIDISDLHIANAWRINDAVKLPVQWYCCDILATPAELNGTADLVYIGRGALCWLHDIAAWAAVIARLLRPGGIVSLFDDHPVNWLFSQETRVITASGVPYFDYAESNRGWSDEYIGDLGKPRGDHAVKYERLWTIADIFQALTGAGLSVLHLGEYPDEYWNGFPLLPAEEKRKLPMTFGMIGKKAGVRR